jgi:hypothetical protein
MISKPIIPAIQEVGTGKITVGEASLGKKLARPPLN